jgi:hypothetical protein
VMSVEREVVEALADVWDREPDTIWEPWRPEVGQRVQIRLSGECQHEATSVHLVTGVEMGRAYGHPADLDGRTGQVGVAPTPSDLSWSDGHVYAVYLDEPLLVADGVRVVGLALAACELIPLDGSR